MNERSTTWKRVIVISDLHLGGGQSGTTSSPGRLPAFLKRLPAMMSRPERLAGFLEGLRGQLRDDEQWELVIAGDFVDFLCIEPWSSWTPKPAAACAKLDQVMNRPPFGQVFDALRSLVAAGCDLTILLGNHDLELALPAVPQALWERLEAGPHRVLFLTDGRAYRIGGLLIEHGNRYDGANANDWEHLRLIASAQSRGEASPFSLRVSAGSQIVENVINPLKKYYPFLDLLQPQNELVALLLLAFEPGLSWDWGMIARMRNVAKLQEENLRGEQPRKKYQIAASPLDQPDEELRAAFGQVYEQLLHPTQEAGQGGWLRVYLQNRKDSVSEILRRGEHVPADRLHQIRLMMRRLLLNDRSLQWKGPTGPYGKAAKRLIADGDGVQAVVMGHTHLPRKIRMGKGWYINTGTWIDRILVPGPALKFGADAALEQFLRDLLDGRRPDCPATYADARIGPKGNIEEIELREVVS